jgi:hypothetical protein
MPYPITGEFADLTVSTASTDLAYLIGTALRSVQATVAWEGSELDSTGFNGAGLTMRTMVSGLRSGTINFTGIYPKTAPRLGNSGQVTFASGTATWVQSWNVNIDFGEQEITPMTGSEILWRRWMPGGIGTWGGSFTTLALDTPVYTLTTNAGGQGAAATFKLTEDAAADPTLAGNIIVTGVSHPLTDRGSRQELTYTFAGSGPLAQNAGTNLPGLLYSGTTPTNISRPQWDTTGTDGVPDITCVLQYGTSRTFTGPGFWRSLNIECNPAGLVTVSGAIRMADAWAGA